MPKKSWHLIAQQAQKISNSRVPRRVDQKVKSHPSTNTAEEPADLGLCDDFIETTPKILVAKADMQKWECIKVTQTSCPGRATHSVH